MIFHLVENLNDHASQSNFNEIETVSIDVLDKVNESLNEDLLTEKTTTYYELGKHLMADIVNSDKKFKGLRSTIVNKYRQNLFNLCQKLTKTTKQAEDFFDDITNGDWETHHINGIHNNNSIKDYNNLALARTNIHQDLTNQNYKIIGQHCSKLIPFMNHEETDKLLLRLVVVGIQNNLNLNSIVNFKTDGFDTFLKDRIPQILTENFYKQYPYSTTDVILLRDLV